jgi:Zn finger protein HypA/HybF involved in hydrogenase expression
MHETKAITELLDRMVDVCWQSGSWRVISAKVKVGALLNFTPQHLNEHFELVARGTPAEGCKLDVVIVDDLSGPGAYQIVLESIEVKD